MNFEMVEHAQRARACELIWHTGAAMPVRTMISACIYFHRFFMVRTLQEVDAMVAAKACLFLAVKAEETGLTHVSSVCDTQAEAPGILLVEHLVLKALRFDCTVEPPHDHLIALLHYWQALAVGAVPVSVKVAAWHHVNRSLHTMACLCCSPRGLAVGALSLALGAADVPHQIREVFAQHAQEILVLAEYMQILDSITGNGTGVHSPGSPNRTRPPEYITNPQE